MKGKILILCGTGSIGSHTVRELSELGYSIDVTTQDSLENSSQVRYFKVNSYDNNVLKDILQGEKYDAIIDFHHYNPEMYTERLNLLADNASQLIFLSSYRVYADLEHPIKETSPQLIDVTDDPYLLNEENYAMYKSRCERIINASPYKNKVTIIRPVISFYYRSLSLITTPAPILIPRSLEGKKVLLPVEGKDVVAGYNWSGNTAKYISRLVLNPKAYGEAFTLASHEKLTWGEFAEYYREYLGTDYEWVDKETYLKYGTSNTRGDIFGLDQDRLLDRSVDISKVLSATGLSVQDLTPLKDAIKLECEKIKESYSSISDIFINESATKINCKLDEYFNK
ncbi:MAG: NAD-dependent epimerase/dehydratase family protein [Ruminococcaceae bacterium]|nr:NAD-dependent epimerase/dehydratase family protein [Oscillospiraceae bacterium]